MSMLELRRVSKVYGQGTAGVHALADVSDPGPRCARGDAGIQRRAGQQAAVFEPGGRRRRHYG